MIQKMFLLLVVGFLFFDMHACRRGCGLKDWHGYPKEYWDMKKDIGNAAWGDAPEGKPDTKPEELSVVIERYKDNPKWRHALGTLLLDAIKGDNLKVVHVLLQSMSKKEWRKVDFVPHILPCAVAMREHSLELDKTERFFKTCATPVRTTEVLQALLDFGFSPNIRCCGGHTPQHVAVEKKDVAALQLLLAYRARLNIKDDQEKLPVDVGWYVKGDAEKNTALLDTLLRNRSRMPRRESIHWQLNYIETAQELALAQERKKQVGDVVRGPENSCCVMQ